MTNGNWDEPILKSFETPFYEWIESSRVAEHEFRLLHPLLYIAQKRLRMSGIAKMILSVSRDQNIGF